MRERGIHQKTIENDVKIPSQNRWKINTNFMVEKGMHKTQKIIQNGSRKGAKIQPKIFQKSNRTNYENKLKKNPPMGPRPLEYFALPPPPPPNPPLGNFRCKSNGPRRSVNSAQALPVIRRPLCLGVQDRVRRSFSGGYPPSPRPRPHPAPPTRHQPVFSLVSNSGP